MRKLLLMALVLGFASWSYGYDSAQGWCQKGGVTVKTGGNSSTTTVQGSFPTCTVRVNIAGTNTLAVLYSNSTGTTLANPFTATSAGHWQFYAASGAYDVILSGGTPSPGITLTLTGVVVSGVTPGTVAALPTCSSTYEGQTAAVTNSSVVTWGSTVMAGGSSRVQVYCNGTSWTVSGK